jgi:hypothetical protein
MPTVTPVHPFARFGAGPYSFVSLETSEDREEKNAAAERARLPFTTNMCGGSCDLCGTAIWNVYTFATADGRKFKVGCECAEKAGEGHLVREGKQVRRESQRADARRERAETERRTREDRLESERVANDAAGHGRLTNDELATKVVADREAAMQARRDASRHFGTVGKRSKKVTLRKEGVYAYESAYGWQRIYFLRVVGSDEAIIWKTSGVLGRTDAQGMWEPIAEGETFVAAFTVKKHGEYTRDGAATAEQQTEVTRLKVDCPKRETQAQREQREADVADRRAAEKRAYAREVIQSRINLIAPEGGKIRARISEIETALTGPLIVKESTRKVLAELLESYRGDLARHEAEIAAMQSEMDALG